MKRRTFAGLFGFGGLGLALYHYWPDQGLWNPCLQTLPDELKNHELVQAAWDGIDPSKMWDCHVHLIGTGDNDSGIWISPHMDDVAHPREYVQKRFYLNAGCAENPGQVDASFLDRLLTLHKEFRPGGRLVLLAFDYHHDSVGARRSDRSTFYTPNHYAQTVARRFPEHFSWMASVHPYRTDAVEELERAVANGAVGVKWLPPAMGMDPASPRCDVFYQALARLRVPLLTHAGEEAAVHVDEAQTLGNPLRLRRALDHGVTVIVAHCASLGIGLDLDKGPNGPTVDNFALFARMMEDPRYEKRLYGDISAVMQVNRLGTALDVILGRSEWHARLLNGSDYPLPAVMPLFSLTRMVRMGYLQPSAAKVLSDVRRYNPLLFDFVLKRTVRADGRKLATAVFHTRSVFERVASKRPARGSISQQK